MKFNVVDDKKSLISVPRYRKIFATANKTTFFYEGEGLIRENFLNCCFKSRSIHDLK